MISFILMLNTYYILHNYIMKLLIQVSMFGVTINGLKTIKLIRKYII